MFSRSCAFCWSQLLSDCEFFQHVFDIAVGCRMHFDPMDPVSRLASADANAVVPAGAFGKASFSAVSMSMLPTSCSRIVAYKPISILSLDRPQSRSCSGLNTETASTVGLNRMTFFIMLRRSRWTPLLPLDR